MNIDGYVKIKRDIVFEKFPDVPIYIISKPRKSIPKCIPLYISRDEITGGLVATVLVNEKSLDRFRIETKVVYKGIFHKKPALLRIEFIVDPFIVPKDK